MQPAIIFSWPRHKTTLHISEGNLTAEVQYSGVQKSFTKEQITYGIMRDHPHEMLWDRIKSLRSKNIAAFPFPKENPTELWLFEAVPMAGTAIRYGKEYLKQKCYKKALKKFEEAIKLQRLKGGETQELEEVISWTQKQRNLFKYKQIASLYLPTPKEIKHFEDVLATYGDHDDLPVCFQDLTAIEEHLLPHHHLMAAFAYESQKQWQGVIEAYLRLADNNPHALGCIEKAYAMLEKAKLEERISAIRMTFEKYLLKLSRIASSPTCFICFNAEEQDVAKWIEDILAPDLDWAGIKPLFCFRDLNLGQNLNDFHEIARKADVVIIACTPELKAKYEKMRKAPVGFALEIKLINQRHTDKPNSVFPVILKSTKEQSLPGVYFESTCCTNFCIEKTNFQYFVHAIELFAAMKAVSKVEASRISKEFIQEIKPILQGDIEHLEVARWQLSKKQRVQALPEAIAHRMTQMTKRVNLPLPPLDFTGRKEELNSLHAACCQRHRIAITGLGGVGKTALALQYANRYQSHYPLIHFMLASTTQLVVQGLLKLADDLFVPATDKVEERLSWLKATLDRGEQDCLLIFDGIDDVDAFAEMEKYLPDRKRCLLLTSRLTEKSKRLGFELIGLKSFSDDDATEYLLKVLKSQDREGAQKLAEKLGRLPLALTHAASYISRRYMAIQDYIEEFERWKFKLFEHKQLDLKPEKETILTTWNLSMDAIILVHNCVIAKEALAFIALLGQAPIPRLLVKEWFKLTHAQSHELELENALAYLSDYSILASSAPNTYGIHPLVQEVMRYQLSEEAYTCHLTQALQTCHAIVHHLDLEIPHMRRQLAPLLPHFRAIVGYGAVSKDKHSQKLFEVFGKIWECDYHDRQNQDLEKIARTCLELSPNDEAKVVSLNHLGLSLQQLGKYKEALGYLLQALKLCQAIYEKNHPVAAQTLNNLGATYWAFGNAREALKCYEDALRIRQEILGEKPPQLVTYMSNIGACLEQLGNPQKALDYHMQALEIKQASLGEKHFKIILSLENIGSALNALGDYSQALKYKKQALNLRKELLGDKHPDVATSLNNIGSTLKHAGKCLDALEYSQQALKLIKETLGEKHPRVAASLNNIGVILGQLKRYGEARDYHIQALNLHKEILGERHPEVARSLNNLGTTLCTLNEHEKALEYQMQALIIREEILGDKHPEVAESLDKVGLTLIKLDRPAEALQKHTRALGIRKAIFEEKHPAIAKSFNNIGMALGELNRHEEALKYYQKALEIIKQTRGEKHPDIAKSFIRIGMALDLLSNHAEALLYYKQALELEQKYHWGL